MEMHLNQNLQTLFKNLENFINSKSVIGEPLQVGDTTLIPIVDVTFGVGAGAKGSKTEAKCDDDSGVGGLGAKISPSAMIAVHKNGNIQLINIKNQNTVNKLIDMVPGILEKFNFKNVKEEDFKAEMQDGHID